MSADPLQPTATRRRTRGRPRTAPRSLRGPSPSSTSSRSPRPASCARSTRRTTACHPSSSPRRPSTPSWRRCAAGTGPVAVDAERASGYRYGQRAFLVQLRREGAGTVLLDPAALPDLSAVGAALEDAEWVLHAASQDLPCLADVGMRPRRLFDTELGVPPRRASSASASRPSSRSSWASAWPRSTRRSTGRSGRCPSPGCATPPSTSRCSSSCATCSPTELERQGKLGVGPAGVRGARRRPARRPPQRPVAPDLAACTGCATRRQLAVVRELWVARDALARAQDVSPGRIIPDAVDRRGRAGPARDQARPRGDVQLHRPGLPPPRRRLVRGRPAGARPARRRPPAAAPADGGAAAGAGLGRARPGGRRPAEPGTAGDGGTRRGARPPGREPAVARHGPPAVLVTAGARRRGRRPCRAGRPRRPALADRPDRGRADRGASRTLAESDCPRRPLPSSGS